MEKSKSYKDTYFSADVIKRSLNENIKEQVGKSSYRLRRENETLTLDDEREFFAEYRKPHDSSTIRKFDTNISITINYTKNADTTLIVEAKTRGEIENVFELFEENHSQSIVPNDKQIKTPVIFIGHGRSSLWRDLKDHMTDKHDYKIEAYETDARAGHTIRDVLDEMANKSSFAILVMTGEDEDKEGKLKARPNIIHEIGLFQGRLGFSRAIVLLEDETEEFSNLFGIQQIRFSKGNIKEVFGDILATLKREFDFKK
ncbi:nucleotide-binding protein [Pedobacter aquatilis]|uniref:nucleotide-binding protein n=1 Tax=Pedobacter aquatilis TaxID=351343 RepID=UPI0025B38EDE|nr:nucleotide-binding protein [Pedobacter aquatilis]MDN3586886.1 nucleotide-binding protein [Pedobacter aquatilis]